MRSLQMLAAGLALVFAAQCHAHLCNNIYRTPDRLVIKPEKDVATIERDDEFRVFVKNNFPAWMDNVRLSVQVEGEGLTATITPTSIPRMKAGEKAYFTVHVAAVPGAAPARHRLQFSLATKQVGFEAVGEAPVEELYKAVRDGNPSPGVLAAETLVRRHDPAGKQAFEQYIAKGRGGVEYACRALRAMGRAGDPDLAPLAVGCLGHQNGQIRGNALLALGLLKACDSVADQVRQAAESRDAFVRTCAQSALDMQGDESMAPALREALKSSNPYVRVAAAWALALHGDKDAVAALDAVFSTSDATLIVMSGDALVSAAERQDGTEGWSGTETEGEPMASVAPPATPAAGQAAPGQTVYATTDRLSYKVEAPVPALGSRGTVTVLLYHSYPTALHNVSLRPESEFVELRAPARLAELKPTSIEPVRLELQVKEQPASDRLTVPVTITADELAQSATINVPVPVTKEAAAALNQELSVALGSTTVQVLPFSNLLIYLGAVACLVLIGIVIWRTRRSNRPGSSGGHPAVGAVIG